MGSASGNLMPVRIMASLKRVMKSRQVTYRELARRISLSEPSVKRIFSRASLTLSRLDEICQALEVTLSEVVRLSGEASADAPEVLTVEQENALAADPNLLACLPACQWTDGTRCRWRTRCRRAHGSP